MREKVEQLFHLFSDLNIWIQSAKNGGHHPLGVKGRVAKEKGNDDSHYIEKEKS